MITEKDLMDLPAVLLVEDNIINANVVKIYLKDICRITHCKDGVNAIDRANCNEFELILMDINLGKGIDGITTSKEIRKIERYKETPIVAVTGYSFESDKERFLSEGLTHYLSKPFSKEEITNLVRDILDSQRTC